MDIKKILIVALILIAFCASFTAISAESKSVSGSKLLVDNKLTLNGINFIIPDGYEETDSDSDNADMDNTDTDSNMEMDTEDIDGTAVDNAESSEFKNSAGDKIEVKVGIKANNEKIQSINPANAEQKTIAGKEGYLIKQTKDGKEVLNFEYLQDGKIVKITASNEDIINSLIA